MSSLVIGNVRCVDPASGSDGHGGVRIENQVIAETGGHLARPEGGDCWIDGRGLVLAPGLIDLSVRTGEPGFEHRETLASAARAAAAGGVTSAVVMPNTDPVIDSVALCEFIRQRARDTACIRMYPAAALTAGLAGGSMTEMGLMREHGVTLFCDGRQVITDTALLARAMSYGSSVGALVGLTPDTPSLSDRADVNAGPLADRMGLAGAPPCAEWIGLGRDLCVAEATGGRLLVDQISTARSVDMICQARSEGLGVVSSVAAHHLHFNELDIGDYLTHRKVWPPLRAESDRSALVEAVADGRIDVVVSGHDPRPAEEKRLPFVEAARGAVGLETLLASLTTLAAAGRINLIDALAAVTCRPAQLLGLEQGRLAVGAPADLVLFDPEIPWVCSSDNLISRSGNSPFDGQKLSGRVRMTLVAGDIVFDQSGVAAPAEPL